jgi:lipooligosaccharide transport system ATP-binding protein
MVTHVVSAEKVYKSFSDVCAVCDLSFEVEEATCFSFLGPNGAGKTTMMKILYGKARRDNNSASRVAVFGLDPEKNSLDIKYVSGVVPQEDNLDVELNVIQNLLIYARFFHIPVAEAKLRIDKLLRFMELADKSRALIRELSGGMKRRLLIVRALLGNPRLLILDEPTTGLDPQVRQLIWDKLRALKTQGVTILLTTHYMEEAFQLADSILIMDKGKKVLAGNPKNLLENEIETYVLEIIDKKTAEKLKDKTDAKMRREDAGERLFFFSKDLGRLKRLTKKIPAGSFYIRQSNLEDLFLKTTGRKLNAEQ